MSHYFINNSDLQHDEKVLTCYINDVAFSFISDRGTFSKDQIDYGSFVFLKALLKEELGKSILDVGCGYGTLGIVLKKLTEASVDMVDVNLRALKLAKRNALLNKVDVSVYESDCFSKVSKSFDAIVINPPIRAGKEVIYRMFEEAYQYLNQGGSLFIVMRKNHGAKSAMVKISSIFGDCKVIDKEAGYFILKAGKH